MTKQMFKKPKVVSEKILKHYKKDWVFKFLGI